MKKIKLSWIIPIAINVLACTGNGGNVEPYKPTTSVSSSSTPVPQQQWLSILELELKDQIPQSTIIDTLNHKITFLISSNANLSQMNITKLKTSDGTSAKYNNTVVEVGKIYDLSSPIIVQVTNTGTTQNWTIEAARLVNGITADSMTSKPAVNLTNRTITFNFRGISPKKYTVKFNMPSGATATLLSSNAPDFSKPVKYKVAFNGYSEEWIVRAQHTVRLYDINTPTFNGTKTGFSFDELDYVSDYSSNKSKADIAAFLLSNRTTIYAGAGGYDFNLQTAENRTMFAYIPGANFADFQEMALEQAKVDYNANPKYYGIKAGADAPNQGEVHIARTPAGKYIVIYVNEKPYYTMSGGINCVELTYRILE